MKHAGGRPPFTPTDEMRAMVQAMTINGVPQTDIADAFAFFPGAMKRISLKTLQRKFKNEISAGPHLANAKVTSSLFRMATDKNHKSAATAAIFWLKTRAGWKETHNIDIGNRDGVPLRIETIDPTQLTDDELNEFVAGRITEDLIHRLVARGAATVTAPTGKAGSGAPPANEEPADSLETPTRPADDIP